ncbi:cytochrome c oxidase subunit II [Benzoatithermus flavus]|uniref:cytochrome-c oxidase n=1 Tax=Benzoatithermus flavus TaxID=3108223 RepID=A0ABU8XY01_9PROT
MNGFQSALHPAGPQALHIERLIWLFTGISAFVLLAVTVALLWAVFRRRERRDLAAEPRPPELRERRLGRVVGAAVALTVVLLFVLLTASFATDRRLLDLEGREQLTVHVIGHQWWWEIRYAHGEPARRVITANELHIPVGVPVRIELTSPDVIHSFWVPNLHGKQDLIPGSSNAITIEADRPGTYRGQCAEFCGLQHAFMAFLVVAEPEETFDAWYERQLAPAREPGNDQARRGREVFLRSACVMCHRIRGTSASATYGPDLTHLKSRQILAAGAVPDTRGHLAAWIADPQGIKPGARMPITALPPPDFQALLAYLETLE